MEEGRRFEIPGADRWQELLLREMGGCHPAAQWHGRDFLRRLREYDKDLNIIWQPVYERWVAYRVKEYGINRGYDLLTYQFTLQGSDGSAYRPGEWVLYRMRQRDSWRETGGDRKKAVLRHRQAVKEAKDYQAKAQRKERRAIATEAAKSISKYAVRGAHSIIVPKTVGG
jgi:hypothetical protein